jgi:hypothetical protein
MEINTAEPLVPDPNPFEIEIVIAKFKKYKSPGGDQIRAEQIHTGGEILPSEIHKVINSIWSKEELPDQWKEYIIISLYKKGDKTYCSNYRGISNTIRSRLRKYVDEITADHQCGFGHNRSSTDLIFCIRQISVVLHGCQTWSLTLREEHRLRAFENRV